MRISLLPTARCGRGSDRVDPEAIGNVPQRLQSLLVGFMVILHGEVLSK